MGDSWVIPSVTSLTDRSVCSINNRCKNKGECIDDEVKIEEQTLSCFFKFKKILL